MNCSTPGLPVHHQLPESTKTHVHWVCDVIQPSHPLSSPSPALNLSQHQGLFKWVSSLHQVAKVLEFQLQHQSYQWQYLHNYWLGLFLNFYYSKGNFIRFNICWLLSGNKKETKKNSSKSCLTLAIPWTVAFQAPLSMEISWQEYWSGFPFPSLGCMQ